MSYSQSLEQTNTVLHFTDIMCSLGTDFEPSCCKQPSAADFKTNSRTGKKPPKPVTSKRVMGKDRKNWRWDTTSNFWKASLDICTRNSHHSCHGPRVYQDYFQKKVLLLESIET